MKRLAGFVLLLFTLVFLPVSASEVTYTVERHTDAEVQPIGITDHADTAFVLAENTAGQNLSWTPHICALGDCEVSRPDQTGVVWVITRIEAWAAD